MISNALQEFQLIIKMFNGQGLIGWHLLLCQATVLKCHFFHLCNGWFCLQCKCMHVWHSIEKSQSPIYFVWLTVFNGYSPLSKLSGGCWGESCHVKSPLWSVCLALGSTRCVAATHEEHGSHMMPLSHGTITHWLYQRDLVIYQSTSGCFFTSWPY